VIFTVLTVACVVLAIAVVAVVVLLLSLPKRRTWPVPEGLGAVPSMRTPVRRRSAA
jgi:hypothetical protein